jgi:Holliday junction resolvase RusA-like endonuclease
MERTRARRQANVSGYDYSRTIVETYIEGLPKPQPRPRTFTNARGKVRTINPSSVTPWKHRLGIGMSPYVRPDPATGPIMVDLAFYFDRPKRLERVDADKILPHIVTMDVDNLAKAVLDVATDIGIYRDDCQVFDLHVQKLYRSAGSWPRGVSITITELYRKEE